ncbi:MAG: precorrin-6A reductase [Thermosediminibacteraceae bacterium]|nr:precorrin-6A reductase [Thermosediminibacteraceae bacterium]PZN04932.1 MAG: precorrin-6A reductase [Bacillota bacterium]
MILVLAGTEEGRKLSENLYKMGLNVMASVVSEYGKSLLDRKLKARAGPLNEKELGQLIEIHDIKILIDATHPFAADISRTAMKVCSEKKVRYIRFERESADVDLPGVIKVDSFEEARMKAEGFDSIFLTTGSRNLHVFSDLKERGKKLKVRVLPCSEVIKKCEELGFLPDEIIAAKGPFSEEMNYIMFRDFKAEVVVTKESGPTGGVLEKIKACRRLQIPLIVIRRPCLSYPVVVRNMEELLKEMGPEMG